jgi:CAAX protease family protein
MIANIAASSAPAPAELRPSAPRRWRWVVLAAIEVALAAVTVVFDRTVPTLPLLLVAALGLLVRREGFATLGFHRLTHPRRVAGEVLALTAAWAVLQLALFFPVLEHISGEQQDLSDFDGLQGNAGKLLVLLALSWTLAAGGEEFVFRGWIPTRITNVLGGGAVGVAAAVGCSSVLFALIHTEQGVIGVAATFLDAIFFSVLRLRYRTGWASWMAHGFNNTLGLGAFFAVGPITGLW